MRPPWLDRWPALSLQLPKPSMRKRSKQVFGSCRDGTTRQVGDAAPLIAGVLDRTVEGGHYEALVTAGLRGISRAIIDNRDMWRSRIHEESPWWVPGPGRRCRFREDLRQHPLASSTRSPQIPTMRFVVCSTTRIKYLIFLPYSERYPPNSPTVLIS